MLEYLRTPLRRKLLACIFDQTTAVYVRELAGLTGEDPGNCSRELKRFEREGIIVSATRGRAKFYALNPAYPKLGFLKKLLKKDKDPKDQSSRVLFLCATNLRRKLFEYALRHREEDFYIREIAGVIGEDAGNLSRELKVFERAGLFESRVRANARFYKLNTEHELIEDLEKAILKEKDKQ